MPIDARGRLNGSFVWLIRGATEPDCLHAGHYDDLGVATMVDRSNEVLEPRRHPVSCNWDRKPLWRVSEAKRHPPAQTVVGEMGNIRPSGLQVLMDPDSDR